MKDGIRLRIGEQWAVLPDDISISIEMTSPLWNESGTFSYSFEIPYTENSHLFGMASLPEATTRLNNFREKFELYVDGVCLLNGDIVCSGEEVDLEGDSIAMELRSDLSVFDDAIKDANVQNLPFDFHIANWHLSKKPLGDGLYSMFGQDSYANAQYPEPFTNIPVLVNSERTYITQKGCKDEYTTVEKKPLLLSPYRSFSSPCFYLLYIYDEILKYAGFHIDGEDSLKKVDDIKRIIVLNNKFVTRWGDYEYPQNNDDMFEKKCNVYLTSENLPNISMTDFMDVLKRTFGLRLITVRPYQLKSVLLRDVLTSHETLEMNISEVLSVNRKHIPFSGITVKYGEDDGEEFNYNDYKNAVAYPSYKEILAKYYELTNIVDKEGYKAVDSDTTLYISQETGNYYRVKVDENTGTDASLFEVGQFLPYSIEADKGNQEDEPEEIELNFQPMIPTPVNTNFFNFYYARENKPLPKEAFFVNVNVQWETSSNAGGDEEHMDPVHLDPTIFGMSYRFDLAWKVMKTLCEAEIPFTLGILRNATNGQQGNFVEVIRKDVDGFGNDEWVNTASFDCVTSDCVTHEGSVYDYNGSEQGLGVDLKNLISLKLWNCKKNFRPEYLTYKDASGVVHKGEEIYNNNPSGALPNRGLVPQFLSEYLYFCQHRRLVEVKLYMEISELINIQWDKYYRIAGYRCLINKVSYEVSQDGVGVVTMEIYLI